jgi:hypothetical protein
LMYSFAKTYKSMVYNHLDAIKECLFKLAPCGRTIRLA